MNSEISSKNSESHTKETNINPLIPLSLDEKNNMEASNFKKSSRKVSRGNNPEKKKHKIKKKMVKKNIVKKKEIKSTKQFEKKQTKNKKKKTSKMQSSPRTRKIGSGLKKSAYKKVKSVSRGVSRGVSRVSRGVSRASRAISSKITKGTVKMLRGRANIFSYTAYENDSNDYLIALFIFLRYRENIKKRTIFSTLRKISSITEPALNSQVNFEKNTLVTVILKLHDMVNDISSFNSLRVANKLCLKNCLCLGIVETLRFMLGLNKNNLVKFYETTLEVLYKSKDALIYNNDIEFESRFRIKYETHQHLNFRVYNAYDNGLIYNILNFGMFFHNRRYLYAELARTVILMSYKKSDQKNNFVTKEREVQIKQYEIRQKLFRHYNNTKIDGEYILPNPNSKFEYIGKGGQIHFEYVRKIEAFLKNKDKRRKNKDKIVEKSDSQIRVESSQILDEYLALMSALNDLGKLEAMNPQGTFDSLTNQTSISKEEKNFTKRILRMYFNDTSGLFKGNILSSDRAILDNVPDFQTVFINQIESASLELDYINFKTT
jgi:hypothetical protein